MLQYTARITSQDTLTPEKVLDTPHFRDLLGGEVNAQITPVATDLDRGIREAWDKAQESLAVAEDANKHITFVSQDLSSANKYIDNAYGYIQSVYNRLSSKRSYNISTTGYVTLDHVDSYVSVSKSTRVVPGPCNPPQKQPPVRLTLRSDHDALKRQVDTLKAQLAQLQATTKITPILDTYLRREYDPVSRRRGITIHPNYGDWILTSDVDQLHLSFEGLRAEVGRSIYIQTRKRVYLYANGHSFFGLPGSSTSQNQWLSNNTTYRFVRSSSDSWLVTASSSPYPWT